MLQEPPRSAYDLNFKVFDYPVRVFWGFWALAAVVGYEWSRMRDADLGFFQLEPLGAPLCLVIWVAALFLSILVHELGHSIAFARFGVGSKIVLYHFGGLAIPNSFGSWSGARQGHVGPRENMIIAAAGPMFQLALGGIAILIAYALKVPLYLPIVDWFFTETPPQSGIAFVALNAIVYPSIAWAVLNLIPVFPLDGGQILRGYLMQTNVANPQYTTHMISVACGAAFGLYLLMNGEFFGIMFLLFAANNFQQMQYGGQNPW